MSIKDLGALVGVVVAVAAVPIAYTGIVHEQLTQNAETVKGLPERVMRLETKVENVEDAVRDVKTGQEDMERQITEGFNSVKEEIRKGKK